MSQEDLAFTVPIAMTHFFLIGLVASSVLWVEEIRKCIVRRIRRDGTWQPES